MRLQANNIRSDVETSNLASLVCEQFLQLFVLRNLSYVSLQPADDEALLKTNLRRRATGILL